jgi:single-stranded DNA-binding protein
MNLWTIDGEIYKAPQFSKSAKGVSVVKLTIKNGKSYYQFVAFKDVADNINGLNLNNGDVVSIEANIQPNNYEKNGQKVYGYNFIVENLTLEEKSNNMIDDDDLPFASGSGTYPTNNYLD